MKLTLGSSRPPPAASTQPSGDALSKTEVVKHTTNAVGSALMSVEFARADAHGDSFRAANNVGVAVTVGLVATQSALELKLMPQAARSVLGGAFKVSNGATGILGLAALPGRAATADRDIREALRTGSAHDIAVAADSSGTVGKFSLYSVNGVLEGTRDAQSLKAAYGAAAQAHSVEGVSGFVNNLKTASRAMVAPLATGGANVAAAEAVARVATGPVGRIAGSFFPGVLLGVAALDCARVASAMADPKKGWDVVLLRGATAALTVVGALGIPVLSQVAGLASVAGHLTENHLYSR